MRNLAGAVWRKSSYSALNDCVEVAFLGDRVAVRDSKQRHGAVVVFTATQWRAFIESVRAVRDTVSDGCVAIRDAGGQGAVLRFSAAEWRAFRAGVNDGEFDLPDAAA